MQRQLTPATTYYIRKLLHHNTDRLTFPTLDRTGEKANANTDLSEILTSLYVKAPKIEAVIGELERLMLLHQSLTLSGVQDHQEIQNAEAQVFGLLGCELQTRSSEVVVQTAIGSVHHAASQVLPPPQLGTLLVVDAEPTSRQLLEHALTYHGYKVFTAADGKAALRRMRELQPDAVLLDAVLPDINGYAVCQHLKAMPSTQTIPVVFVSAIASASAKAQAFRVKGADYIAKPFDVEEVLVRVAHHVNAGKRQRQLEARALHLQQKVEELRQAEEKIQKAAALGTAQNSETTLLALQHHLIIGLLQLVEGLHEAKVYPRPSGAGGGSSQNSLDLPDLKGVQDSGKSSRIPLKYQRYICSPI